MPHLILHVEGTLDKRIMEQLFQAEGKVVTVFVSKTGKAALPHLVNNPQVWTAYLRDRDFDREPQALNEPISFGKRGWSLSRTMIENYLLEPALLEEVSKKNHVKASDC